MKYTSTRNSSILLNSKYAIAKGISDEGGLFVPCNFPKYSYEDLNEIKCLDYIGRAKYILKDFLVDFSDVELQECLAEAYGNGKFDNNRPAPILLEQNTDENIYVLELWHGPTSAFKDMALQILPHLLTKSFSDIYGKKEAVILVATSGDAGIAALEAFKNVAGTKVIVFYPEEGVSPVQKIQMDSQEGNNIFVCGVRGNFDDIQSEIKDVFTDPKIKKLLEKNDMLFSSANSMNIGRLIPQIVYYFSAYCDLMNSGEIDYDGEKVNIVVPTGNFGDILAAFYAKEMGLPVNKLICASNSNNVVDKFMKTGIYNRRRKFYKTMSTSMDVLVSSNLERLLYHLTDRDEEKISEWMQQLKSFGKYEIDNETKLKLQDIFYSGFCDEDETKCYIKMMFNTENYLCDPHTAVAVGVYDKYVLETGDNVTPTILVSSASPYKFPESVLSAISNDQPEFESQFEIIQHLSAISRTKIPKSIEALRDKNIIFNNVCNKGSISKVVLKYLGINVEEEQ